MSPSVRIDVDRLTAAREAAEEDLLSDVAVAQSLTAESGTEGYGLENIVGVGLSERLTNGRPTGDRAVSVYVVRKAPPDEIDDPARVPEHYDGVPTDVVESGEFIAQTERGRFRPAPSGVSIGLAQDQTGTLGFVCKHDAEIALVSNNHVLAKLNEAQPSDLILQPGPADGGTAEADAIATLGGFQPLDFDQPNVIDAAFGVVQGSDVSSEIYGYGSFVTDPLEPLRDMLVRKSGRTSGVTRGIIRDVDATAKIRYGRVVLRFRDQVIVDPRDRHPFSEPGDSGSLVFEEATRQPVGLLCGGTPRYTVVNRIEHVLDGLGVSLGT